MRLALTTAALWLALTSAACAHHPTPPRQIGNAHAADWEFPNPEPIDGLMRVEHRNAVLFWRERLGVLPCDNGHGIHATLNTDLGGGAVGRGGNCRTYFDRAKISAARGGWSAGARAHRRALQWECWTVHHEVGHAIGLAMPIWDGTAWLDTHPARGVMSQDQKTGIPGDCKTWARRIYRERKGT